MNRLFYLFFSLVFVLLGGCSLLPTSGSNSSGTGVSGVGNVSGNTEKNSVPAFGGGAQAKSGKPKLALVLGGGAARGFAHIGVIKVLEANGIVPDLVVGTSAGSVVGALYASGMSALDMQKNALFLEEGSISDISLSTKGLLRGDALQNWVNRFVGQRSIEQLPRRFVCTGVVLNTGRLVVFERGNTGQAVRASSSVPGVFQPTLINGVEYIDGGVVSPVPVKVARQLGADVVIAVDISSKPVVLKKAGALDIVLQAVTILGETVAGFEIAQADVVIQPAIGHVGSTDFKARHMLILEGEQAALLALSKIRQLLML